MRAPRPVGRTVGCVAVVATLVIALRVVRDRLVARNRTQYGPPPLDSPAAR